MEGEEEFLEGLRDSLVGLDLESDQWWWSKGDKEFRTYARGYSKGMGMAVDVINTYIREFNQDRILRERGHSQEPHQTQGQEHQK